jgi:hypothetical protein
MMMPTPHLARNARRRIRSVHLFSKKVGFGGARHSQCSFCYSRRTRSNQYSSWPPQSGHLATSGQEQYLRRLDQFSSTKAIDPVFKNSVHHLILDEHKKLNAVILEGIKVTDQLDHIQQPNSGFGCPKIAHRRRPEQTSSMHSSTQRVLHRARFQFRGISTI